ncbi:hypothetical protein H310_00402 [Aphanomyces invadans]|uniref:Uncharacterized protein n=1 Tax=Aphanomyces invadans TaxID=157072 RepID=A0A024UTZ7_9STRA|nr:hypothetical protein H310_00402 [Aphanomyces invadans]ETW09991.1 hypothetical protein H310_00402 [Aphanomyces invadans]|eukprot:XP_008861402.1 hypothetical protein H310_00402 [Aphanomyces invadans]
MSVQARILVLPVWSDLIVRAQPPPSTLLSVSCCLRLFSVHTPAGSVKVTVEERYGHAMASHVWDAGICLSFFLQTHYIPHLNPSTSLRAMEIASGSGLLGLVLATLLPARSTLVLTEKPTSLELLQHNLEQLQPISSTHISICGLEWGNQVHLLDLPHRDKSTDLLVLADVLYNWAAHPQLWSTVAAVASPSTTIYLAHKHRAATSTAALRHLETYGTCPSCPAVSCALNSPSSCGWKNGLWKLHRCASYGATDIFQLVIQPPHTEMDV